MRTTLFVLAAIFVVTATEAGAIFQRRVAPCNDANTRGALLSCYRGLQQYNFARGLPFASINTSAALNHFCGGIQTATDCVANVIETCGQNNPFVRVMRDTLQGVAGHMCSPEGRQVILSKSECWQHDEVKVLPAACIMGNRSNANQCEMFTQVRSCTRATMQRYCDNHAVQFVDELLYLYTKPFATDIAGCGSRRRMARSILSMLSLTL